LYNFRSACVGPSIRQRATEDWNGIIVIVISRFLKRYLKSKRTRAPAYSPSAATNQRGFPKGVKRSSGSISRIPGGDIVTVKVGVVQMRGMVSENRGRVTEVTVTTDQGFFVTVRAGTAYRHLFQEKTIFLMYIINE